MTDVVTAFARAAEARDVGPLRTTLHPNAVQYVRRGGEWSALPTDRYLGLMAEGKIGGEPVQLEVLGVERGDGVSTVRAHRTTPSLRFDDTLVLVENEGRWVITSAAVIVTPVGK